AREGADHAVLAAVSIAALERDVLGLAEAAGRRVAVWATRLVAVDREGRAAVAQHHHDLAARPVALARSRRARPARPPILRAIGRAGADRHRAGGLRRGGARDQKADTCTNQCSHDAPHDPLPGETAGL